MSKPVLDKDLILLDSSVVMCIPSTVPLNVVSGNKLIADSRPIAIMSDITSMPGLTVSYSTPLLSIPGVGVITFKGWDKISSATFKGFKPILLQGGTGVATLSVTLPAQAPGTPPIPDPLPTYTITFTIQTNGNISYNTA